MKYSIQLLTAILILALSSCSSNNKGSEDANSTTNKELLEKGKTYFSALPLIAKNSANIKSKEKIDLGHKLYFDTQLSKDQTISCNSCHNLATFGVDNEATSIGDDGWKRRSEFANSVKCSTAYYSILGWAFKGC
jgi:cytochrome c peroxidase